MAKPKTDSDYENLMTLRYKPSDWNIAQPHVIQSKKCNTTRVSTIQIATHISGVQVQIANVHLCGGRFDEEVHCKTINEPTAKSASIVLGDFDSDIIAYQDTNNDQKLKFLTSNSCSKEGAQMWHDAPRQTHVVQDFIHYLMQYGIVD